MADNSNIIKCPACAKDMKKIYISSAGLYLDVCIDGCGGIYFDNREYNKFDEAHEDAKELFDAIKDKVFVKVDETQIRECPVCKAKMVKNYSSVKHNIQLDECYTCGAKFLDGGEILKIREEYLNDNERIKDLNKYIENTIGLDIEENERLGAKARADVTNVDRLSSYIRKILS